MKSSGKSLEWLILEEGDPTTGTWPQVDAAPPHKYRQLPVTEKVLSHLYELLVCIALVYGVALLLLWYQTAQRMAHLEANLDVLRHALTQQSSTETADMERPSLTPTAEQQMVGPYRFETPYLRFESIPSLAALIPAVAEQSDAHYRRLRRDFGLGTALSVPKVTIVINPEMLYEQWCSGKRCVVEDEKNENHLSVRVTAMVGGSDEALRQTLLREIRVAIAKYSLTKALQGRAVKPPWRALTGSFYLYLERAHGLPQDWQWDSVYLTRRHFAQDSSLEQVQLQFDQSDTQREESLQRSVLADELADPLLEFMVERYGYAIVPPLLDAWEKYSTWEAVAPVVFGISAHALEADWHHYLKIHYPRPDA